MNRIQCKSDSRRTIEAATLDLKIQEEQLNLFELFAQIKQLMMNLTVLSPDFIEMNRNVGKGIYCLDQAAQSIKSASRAPEIGRRVIISQVDLVKKIIVTNQSFFNFTRYVRNLLDIIEINRNYEVIA